MRSRSAAWTWLLRKEVRELLAAPSWWVLVVVIGPLVGFLFRQAVHAYAEISAGAGAGCGLACVPLVGIWLPTFGAYEVAAIFLLPFVAIRAGSVDRQSGALMLELQQPLPGLGRVAAKAVVLAGGWCLTLSAGGLALLCWWLYGGVVHPGEVLVGVAGHVLNGALTIAVALSVALIVEHPATAAIVTLAATIGTWVIGFGAALYGGGWDRVAAFTPAAVLDRFEHGLAPLGPALALVAAGAAALGIGAVWLRLDRTRRWRWLSTAAVSAAAAAVAAIASTVPGSWDASASRYNSFPASAEARLRAIDLPVAIDVHLAPQDPRRAAFERGPLAKLRRVVPDLVVRYAARSGTGLYESADPGYGLIRYAVGDRHGTSYVVTDDGVLEALFILLGLGEEIDPDEPFDGEPLAVAPTGSGLLFYLAWPAMSAGLAWFMRRGS